MAKKSNLPAVVHDHFRKANVLHGYTETDLGNATTHALETGQELLAAKTGVPHGGWEIECKRLFDGTLRTAQFYMQFTKDVLALSKAQRSTLFFLEGTLEGTSKAARRLAKPKPATKSPPPDVIDVDSEPVDAPEETPKPPKGKGKPPKQFDRSAWLKQWEQAIGPVVRLVDKIAAGVDESGCDSQKVVQDHLNVATEEMTEWMRR